MWRMLRQKLSNNVAIQAGCQVDPESQLTDPYVASNRETELDRNISRKVTPVMLPRVLLTK